MVSDRKQSERERKRLLYDKESRNDRSITIDFSRLDKKRRDDALGSVFKFCETYFGFRFHDAFTPDQLEMVEAILTCARYGGDQSIAAPRGGGKTTIAECVTIYCLLAGLLKFPLIVAATGTDASRILDNIKYELEFNDLLRDDFAEVCDPIRALEGAVQRQNMQIYNGERTMLKWSHDLVVLPTVENSRCSGAVIMTRGLDGAIRGIRYHEKRPDFVLIDDPETRESADSDHQIEIRERTIDRDIAGVGGPGKRIAKLVLCTISNRKCLAHRLTCRRTRPSFNGKRFGLIVEWPKNRELWEDYMRLRREGNEKGDRDARDAMTFYVANRAAMDEGSIVSNPARFVKEVLPDGSTVEISALQHCYNIIADRGLPAFLSEYQNDPPPEDEETLGGITSAMVASRVNGLEYRQLHVDTKVLVSFLDLGDTICNFVDSAWSADCVGRIPDYGMLQVNKDNITLEKAIMCVLHDYRTQLLAKYMNSSGETVTPDLVLIDSGSGKHMPTVYKFCREVGAPFFPSKGMKDYWKPPAKSIKHGDHWALVPQLGGARLYEFNATYWKLFAQQRFITPVMTEENLPNPGSLSLFVVPDSKQFKDGRREFSHQVVGEIWAAKKPGGKMEWIQHGHNHYLDCCAGVCLAASIKGISLLPPQKALRAPPSQRPTAASIAAMAKRA